MSKSAHLMSKSAHLTSKSAHSMSKSAHSMSKKFVGTHRADSEIRIAAVAPCVSRRPPPFHHAFITQTAEPVLVTVGSALDPTPHTKREMDRRRRELLCAGVPCRKTQTAARRERSPAPQPSLHAIKFKSKRSSFATAWCAVLSVSWLKSVCFYSVLNAFLDKPTRTKQKNWNRTT